MGFEGILVGCGMLAGLLEGTEGVAIAIALCVGYWKPIGCMHVRQWVL